MLPRRALPAGCRAPGLWHPSDGTAGWPRAPSPEPRGFVSPLGLYLHIPFCESICNYCNFNRGLLDADVKGAYLQAIVEEIRRSGDGTSVDTIYFGGGTPSLLSPAEVAHVLSVCATEFAVERAAEITLEVNPETATASHLDGWREAGVTRLSFGVQSFRDDELARLGRRHSAARAEQAVRLARVSGFEDLSLDLMLWLPAQTPARCRESVDALLELHPTHASLYLLELYPNAPLKEEMARTGWSLAPDDDAAEMYLDALERTDAAGYEQYEISNIALPSHRCAHNLKYWRDGEWLGFGCGAHSTRGGCRWKNVSETDRYVARVEAGETIVAERHFLTEEQRIGDVLFTGLRLTEGVDLRQVQREHRVDVMARYSASLTPFINGGYLSHEFGRLSLTRRGMLVANEVMRIFV